MKFAKELEEDLVPEWRIKYFNYKIGKKKVKAVSRALRSANRTPQLNNRPPLFSAYSNDQLPYTHYDFTKRKGQTPAANESQPRTGTLGRTNGAPKKPAMLHNRPDLDDRRESVTMFARSPPIPTADSHAQEPLPEARESESSDDDDNGESSSDNAENEDERPLKKVSDGMVQGRARYGSIIGSPPSSPPEEPMPALHLPDPALDPSKKKPPTLRQSESEDYFKNTSNTTRIAQPQRSTSDNVPPKDTKLSSLPNLSKRLFKKRGQPNDSLQSSKTKLKRAFTALALDSPAISTGQGEAYRELDARQEEFFNFLDKELSKVENFYKTKEDEATSRLQVLREQLHEMRDRRLEDLNIARQGGKIADRGILDGQIPIMSHIHPQNGGLSIVKQDLFDPLAHLFQPNGKIGKTSKAREELSSPRQPAPKSKNDRGDYVRKQQPHERVPYRSAKRKLKLALQEFYRGLELLKSYALLNRTAFRKINKKYDKAVMARPPLRYMSEKVNNAHFVTSTLVEETLVQIEDLYARYFERGNRKVAVNKLRSHLRQGEHSSVSFRNGLYVAAGLGLAVSGMSDGARFLFSSDTVLKTQTSYLFQIYGGYFLAVLLFLFFVLDCRIWTRHRINYTFVFEYDTRHVLDWRQLAELPCFFLFLNGLFLWLNFQFPEEHTMFLYWPVVMIGLTVLVIFLPFKILYYTARKWWLYSNWRLLLAGLYPVEFRDFYLGDMYCSETYAMSQLEIFFCLYAHNWNDPPQCNSNHSRLLGFLTTLPAIWRALQCLRRYYDSRNWFPHLANFAKYLGNILYYMTLSLYRVHLSGKMRAVFIVFALLNGLYCSFWDVFMDFSLGNPWSKNFMLRDNLAFRKKRVYYAVMIIDVILRQQWIFYAILTEDLQHSAAMSFFVALAEVIRRGIWSLFRVENEHCNNVVQFRASRDIPLPYSVAPSRTNSVVGTQQTDDEALSPHSTINEPGSPKAHRRSDATATSNDLERARPTTSSSSVRSRFNQSNVGLRALQRVGTVIAAAHSQDFQKKRRPEVVGQTLDNETMAGGHTDSDDDEYDAEEERQARQEAAKDSNRNAQQLDSSDTVDFGATTPTLADETDDNGGEESSASGSASGSGSARDNQRDRVRSERRERDTSTMRRADDMNQAEISEARDRIEAARGPK